MDMKKLLLLLLIPIAFMVVSCSDDDNDNVTNVQNISGQDWYDTFVYFYEIPEGELIDITKIGTVKIGDIISFAPKASYFQIKARTSNGDFLTSELFSTGKKINVSIGKKDIHVY